MTFDTATLAAYVFTGLLALLVLFQLALAAGAPWGALAFGGQNKGTLPVGYRIASGVSILIYGFLGVLALDRVGAIDLLPAGFSEVGMWVVFGFLCLGTLMNAISRSKPERYTMTPVVIVLAGLALVIALA